jgi:hypothetical protein
MTSNFFSPLSFVAVFGSGIRDKHPGSATLIKWVVKHWIDACTYYSKKDPFTQLVATQ